MLYVVNDMSGMKYNEITDSKPSILKHLKSDYIIIVYYILSKTKINSENNILSLNK